MIYSSVYITPQEFYALPFLDRKEYIKIGDHEFCIAMYKDLKRDKIVYFAYPTGVRIQFMFHLEEYDECDITGSLIKVIENYFKTVRFFTDLLKGVEEVRREASRKGYASCQEELRSILGIQED